MDLLCTTYLAHKHRNALWVLREGRTLPGPLGPDYDYSRALCMLVVAQQNWTWPTILDEEYPSPSTGGVDYDTVMINGKPYLQCRDSSVTPTPFQLHALKVLSYTFVIGPLPIATETTLTQIFPVYPVPVPLNGNARANPNAGVAVPELREIPFRPLFAPLAMLAIRTLLLLYFVAPARKPVISILILAWVVYEAWRPIRAVLRRGWGVGADQRQQQQQQQQQRQPQPLQQQAINVPPRPAPGGPVPPAPGGQPVRPAVQGQQQQPIPVAARAAGMQPNVMAGQGNNSLIDSLGNWDLEREEAALAGAMVEEPGILRKLFMFFGLIIATMHPAVWDRRRIALNRREGRVRAEANIRDAADEDGGDERRTEVAVELSARHGRRTDWVKRYIERVLREMGDHEE